MLEAAGRRPRSSRRSGLSGCASGRFLTLAASERVPPVVAYSREFQTRAAEDWDSAAGELRRPWRLLADFAVMREQAEAC